MGHKAHYHLPLFFFQVLLISVLFSFPAAGKGSSEGGNMTGGKSEPLVYFVNYPYQIWSDDFTKIHLTLFKPDFKPARGAVVKVNDKEVGKADANGVCIFDYKPGNLGSHTITAVLKEGGKAYSMRKNFSSNSRTESFRADRLYVYTDRGVYNPGQEVLVRLIAWQLKKEYFPVPGAKVQLLFQDKKGKIFSGEYLTTDNFGIAATRIPLAPNMPEGDYELVVLYEKARETAELRVKRFTPPVINIRHNLKRYLTDSQDSLTADIRLSYFTGAELQAVRLNLEVLSKDKVIFAKQYNSQTPELAVTLYRQELEAIHSQLEPEQWFKVRLAAADSYGQEDEVQWDMLYTARPFTTVLEVDKDAYPAGETVQVLAKIVDLDGQPAADLDVVLEVNEINFKTSGKTDNKGIAVLEFVMPDHAVTAVVKSPQVAVPLAERSIPFQGNKPMISKVKDKPGSAGTVVNLTVNFDPAFVPVEKVVHVDLTDISGALVLSTTIPVHKEDSGYQARGDITSPTWGSMLVNLYCCAVERSNADKALSPEITGFITEGQHVTFYADKRLQIKVDGLGASARPGAAVKFRVEVKGGEGEKALGVSLVDDAVLSLLNPFLKAPEPHFYNPQAKVISTGGAGVLTWPVVDRNWGSPMHDIAYTNWGWKSPGSLEADISMRDEADSGAAADNMMSLKQEEAAPSAGTTGIAPPPAPQMLMEKEMAPSEAKKMSGEDMPAKADGNRRTNDDQAAGSTTPVITIRTQFPETALWEPHAVTQKGKAEFNATLPDSITTQTLSVLATDKKGYISLYQQGIKVNQPLFIRSLLPAGLTLGDELEVSALVQNTGDREVKGTARLTAAGLKVSGGEKDITVPAAGTALVSWQIKAGSTGKQEYTVALQAGSNSDAEQKTLTVLPAGLPRVTTLDGKAVKNAPFSHTFTANLQTGYTVANLNVTLPGILPAFQGLAAFGAAFYYSPWTASAVALMNTAMLEYAAASGADSAFIQQLNEQIQYAAGAMVASQLQSGGWGWYTSGQDEPSLYFTVSCLRALAMVKKAGFEVSDFVLRSALDFILKNRNKQGLWSSKGAYFWEFFNTDTDNALSAEIFEVLMEAATALQTPTTYAQDLDAVKGKIAAVLAKGSQEPMTVAAGLMGMVYYNRYKGVLTINADMSSLLEQLLNLKRRGYWEPHWYHAFGGMTELNARIIELLAAIDYKAYASVIRETVTWLLSTRTAWGTWHNEIGTATAVRALLKAATLGGGLNQKETAGEVVITVNGKQAAVVKIDPADPFLSAARLNYFEITPWLVTGQNQVAVSYSGNLEAAVDFELREWSGQPGEVPQTVQIKRQAPAASAMGQPVTVTIDIQKQEYLPFLTIEESLPANAEADTKSLESLKQQGTVTDYKLDGSRLIIMTAGGQKQIQIRYRLTPTMRGTARHQGLTVTDTATGSILGSIVSGDLTVK